ncbi:MAG: hypothetical protein AABX10_04885 [Nanoarchaeota archaeon]
MKKTCIICEIEIEEEKEFCQNCQNFLEWKHKKDLRGKLERFRKTKAYLDEWREQSTEKEVEE